LANRSGDSPTPARSCRGRRCIAAWQDAKAVYEALEGRGVKRAIRIPANQILERDIAELLTRPAGRPSHKPKPVVWFKGFL
jgi:hypothetical protein